MNILIVSCSLNPDSRSRVLANAAAGLLRESGAKTTLLDLRDHPLPLCDGESCDAQAIRPLVDAIKAADAILLAVPIYNYDVNAAAKNLVEQTGKAWEGRIVGFLCAAGGHGSYMSITSLANSLMLDFRCVIVPRFVYATGDAFGETGVSSPKIRERIDQLASETLRMAKALRQ
jgi:FMN reductase